MGTEMKVQNKSEHISTEARSEGMEDNMKERITELEMRFMQQENTIQELNDTVCRQELNIERIVQELALLRDQLSMIAPLAAGGPDEEEPPPHY
jgi:SlyX protein